MLDPRQPGLGRPGLGWGALYLPRIGHEVVVEFLEGDSDRAIVTGSVYNGQNPTDEQVYLHAQKDFIKGSKIAENGPPCQRIGTLPMDWPKC